MPEQMSKVILTLRGLPKEVQQGLFLGFAARVRIGFFGSSRPVGAQTVKKPSVTYHRPAR
jgi:hypothetical protein